jgi:hypothetical protein
MSRTTGGPDGSLQEIPAPMTRGGSKMIHAQPSDGARPSAEVVVLPYLDWAKYAANELRGLGFAVLLHRAGASGWALRISGPPGLMDQLRRAAVDDDTGPSEGRFEWAGWINGLHLQP